MTSAASKSRQLVRRMAAVALPVLLHCAATAMPADAVIDDTNVARAVAQQRGKPHAPIDLSGFEDGIEHYVLTQVSTDYPRHEPGQIIDIAENLILYQREDGGWQKNLDWLRVVTPGQAMAEMRPRFDKGSTLDNRNTTPQIRYLAEVYNATGIERYRDAALRGVEYLLGSQNDSGGWAGADVDAITYNDDITVGALELLREVALRRGPFGWIDEVMQQRAEAAVERGIAVILATQIIWHGRKTAWCQQHDHVTLEPVKARAYELPSICGWESVGVVQFLMSLEQPTPEVVEAIQSAVKWFDSVKLGGFRIARNPIEPYRDENNRLVSHDVVKVPDAAAPPIWARYYDLEHCEPLFVLRDGTIVPRFEDISQQRREGYDWYGYWPAPLLSEDYPRWRAAHPDVPDALAD